MPIGKIEVNNEYGEIILFFSAGHDFKSGSSACPMLHLAADIPKFLIPMCFDTFPFHLSRPKL
jgi:hypothetical protein